MKALLILLLVATAVVLVVVFGPGSTEQQVTPAPSEQQAQPGQTTRQAQPNAAQHSPAERQGIADTATEVMSYGVGYTQWRAKENSRDRVNRLQEQHNRAVEEATAE